MFSKLKFLSAFSKEKMDQASDSLMQAVVAFDPESATEASIKMMDDQVTKLSEEHAKAKLALDKERKEADVAKTEYNKKLELANMLQHKIEAELDEGKRVSLQKSLDNLVSELEVRRQDVEIEIQEADDAQAVLDSINATLKLAADKLLTARRDHKMARNDMKRAEMNKRMAEQEEQRQRELAGISKGSDGMSIALNAMRESAADDEAKAEARRNKASLLKPYSAEEDSNIAALMEEMEGSPSKASSADKLSSLKGF